MSFELIVEDDGTGAYLEASLISGLFVPTRNHKRCIGLIVAMAV
ncbi:MAG TPA: hypothetical protein VEG30_07625 [Terriglobales bacterium]|nr:hypothetical protein [Terriglobales bacterium]